MFFDKFLFPSPPSPLPSTPLYPLPSSRRPILRRAQNVVEFWNNIILYRKYKILAQQANWHSVTKNIPAAISQKFQKKSVEFQTNFQLLGTKKAARRGSLSINLYLGAIRTPTRLRGEHPRRTTYSQP